MEMFSTKFAIKCVHVLFLLVQEYSGRGSKPILAIRNNDVIFQNFSSLLVEYVNKNCGVHFQFKFHSFDIRI